MAKGKLSGYGGGKRGDDVAAILKPGRLLPQAANLYAASKVRLLGPSA